MKSNNGVLHCESEYNRGAGCGKTARPDLHGGFFERGIPTITAKKVQLRIMEIERINWKDTLGVRHKVLWPNKPMEFCIVKGDEAAKHYGVFCKNELIGVASAYVDEDKVRLRKFAVYGRFQGRGFGSKLLQGIISSEREEGVVSLWCDARESAIGFYEKFGMSIEGNKFYKSGVPYFKMSLILQELKPT